VHDAVGDDPRFDGALDRPGGAHLVDGTHVETVTADRGFSAPGHSERGPKDRCLDVVHGDRVAGQQRADESVPNEPHHVGARARMHERRPGHPDDVAAAIAFVDEERREMGVIDRLLARDLAGHELELAVVLARGGIDMDEDPFAPVLLFPDGDELAGTDASHLANPQDPVAIDHERRIHPRFARQPPFAPNPNVGRQIRRGEEVFGEDTIGRRGHKSSVRRRGKAWCCEIGLRDRGHAAKDA
jgi:hypothetical protein